MLRPSHYQTDVDPYHDADITSTSTGVLSYERMGIFPITDIVPFPTCYAMKSSSSSTIRTTYTSTIYYHYTKVTQDSNTAFGYLPYQIRVYLPTLRDPTREKAGHPTPIFMTYQIQQVLRLQRHRRHGSVAGPTLEVLVPGPPRHLATQDRLRPRNICPSFDNIGTNYGARRRAHQATSLQEH